MKRLLWLGTHRTQWREELPLLLEAGFEVVPGRWGHQERGNQENPDDPYYLQTWRTRCTLPTQTVEVLRSVNWFHEAPPDLIPLACEAFDGVVVEAFVDSLVSIARWFPKPIFFRVYGHGGLTSYSRFAGLDVLRQLSQTVCYQAGLYHWCPVFPTLSFVESEVLTRGEIVLEQFVSPERFPIRWEGEKAEPYVAVVLSRLVDTSYYGNLYRRIVSTFRGTGRSIPLRILGQNPVAGNALRDPEIVGSQPDDHYYAIMGRATAFFYQGDSVCHLHLSCLEAVAMGVPVVMLQSGYLAWALRARVGSEAKGPSFGVVEGLDEARDLLGRCLADPSVPAAIAERQRPLARYFTDQSLAVQQYRARLGAALGDSSIAEEAQEPRYKRSA